jgi:hypothetical protein
MSASITVEVKTSFWTAYRASLAIIKLRPLAMVVSAIFPLAALYLIYLFVQRHLWPSPFQCIAILMALGFTPLIIAFSLFMARRRSVVARGPITYTLSDDGLRAATPVSTTDIKWGAVVRAVETKRFVLIFISAPSAFYIPVECLQGGDLSVLRKLLKAHVAKLKGPEW